MVKLLQLLPVATAFAAVIALPQAGTYNIISRVLGPQGEKLAVTFGIKGVPVTLEPLSSTAKSQIWNLQVYNSRSMTVASTVDTTQQIAPNGANILITKNPLESVFSFVNNATTGYTIGDGSLAPKVFWSPAASVPGAEITWGGSPQAQNDTSRLYWVLVPNAN